MENTGEVSRWPIQSTPSRPATQKPAIVSTDRTSMTSVVRTPSTQAHMTSRAGKASTEPLCTPPVAATTVTAAVQVPQTSTLEASRQCRRQPSSTAPKLTPAATRFSRTLSQGTGSCISSAMASITVRLVIHMLPTRTTLRRDKWVSASTR